MKGFTLVELIVWMAVIIITLAVFAFPFMIRFQQVGEGSHTGYITAVDKRGYIWQNYDVYFKTDNSSSQEDIYCIDRKNAGLATELKAVSELGKKVTIEYRGVRGIGIALCSHTEIVDWK